MGGGGNSDANAVAQFPVSVDDLQSGQVPRTSGEVKIAASGVERVGADNARHEEAANFRARKSVREKRLCNPEVFATVQNVIDDDDDPAGWALRFRREFCDGEEFDRGQSLIGPMVCRRTSRDGEHISDVGVQASKGAAQYAAHPILEFRVILALRSRDGHERQLLQLIRSDQLP